MRWRGGKGPYGVSHTPDFGFFYGYAFGMGGVIRQNIRQRVDIRFDRFLRRRRSRHAFTIIR